MRYAIFGTTVVTLLIASSQVTGAESERQAFTRAEVTRSLQAFYGSALQGFAAAVDQAFEEHGQPNAYITGKEFSTAPGLAVRYGNGTLTTDAGMEHEIHWMGPSIGADAKVFVLVFRLPATDAIFQRYSVIDGGQHDGSGVSMDYLQSADTVLATIRQAVVRRQGVDNGFMEFSRAPAVVPY